MKEYRDNAFHPRRRTAERSEKQLDAFGRKTEPRHGRESIEEQNPGDISAMLYGPLPKRPRMNDAV